MKNSDISYIPRQCGIHSIFFYVYFLRRQKDAKYPATMASVSENHATVLQRFADHDATSRSAGSIDESTICRRQIDRPIRKLRFFSSMCAISEISKNGIKSRLAHYTNKLQKD